MRKIWRKPEILVAVFYFLTFDLALVPYYNWLYRVTVNLLHIVSFWVSLSVIAFIFIRLYINKRRFRRMLLVFTLGLLVLFAGSQINSWRYFITDEYIRSNYCAANGVEAEGLVLGGIKAIKVDGIERTGAFENDSHCVFVACAEEFYYCDDAAVVIEQ